MPRFPIGELRKPSSRIVYAIVIICCVIFAIGTGCLYWLIPPVCVWGILIILESIGTIRTAGQKHLEAHLRLSEIRNMIIDLANDKQSNVSILHSDNPLLATAKSWHREIRLTLYEQKQREYIDMLFDFEARGEEFKIQKTTCRDFFKNIANYLDVERDKIPLSSKTKKRIKLRDRETLND